MMKIIRQYEHMMQKLDYQLKGGIVIGFTFLIGIVSGALLKAQLVTIPDLIQAYSAIALAYFAYVQVTARKPVVFAWAKDWRDLFIENASDYPIFDMFYEYTDLEGEFGIFSDKIKIIHSKKNYKIQLHEEFQGKPSMIKVMIEFRTGDMRGTMHRWEDEILLSPP